MDNDVIKSWNDFVLELQKNILPIYQTHESHFDYVGIHGRMHICRALIFSEVMTRIYFSAGVPVDFYGIRTAIAFHDSGREGNGKDYWESQSVANCLNYLIKQPIYSNDVTAARKVANWVGKHGKVDLGHFVVFDADVLEIMRPCCGHGGLPGFHRDVLHFLGPKDAWAFHFKNPGVFREDIIQEAWKFILETEELKKQLFNSSNYIGPILNLLAKQKGQYQLLAQIIQ